MFRNPAQEYGDCSWCISPTSADYRVLTVTVYTFTFQLSLHTTDPYQVVRGLTLELITECRLAIPVYRFQIYIPYIIFLS